MNLFKSPWFRWFAGAFCCGAAVVPVAVAIFDFKDPKVEIGKFNFNGNTAWVLMALNLGIVSGALVVGVTSLKGLNSKSV